MLSVLQNGGWCMWPILLTSIVAFVVFVERAFHLHRAQIRPDDFLKGLFNILRNKRITEAVSICDETPGPVARVVRAAILHHDKGRETIRQSINDAGLAETTRLEKNMGILATATQVAPLFGLLGTVWGMIRTLTVMAQNESLVRPGDLAGGMGQALLSTAAGLIVAILSYVAYNFLVTRIESILVDLERAANEILAFLTGTDMAGGDAAGSVSRVAGDGQTQVQVAPGE